MLSLAAPGQGSFGIGPGRRHWSGQAVGRQPPAAQTLGGRGGVGSSLVFPVSADCIATGTEVRIDRVDTALQSCHIRANTAF